MDASTPLPSALGAVESSIVPGSMQDFEVNVGDRVLFGYDKYDLTDEAHAVLQKQAAWLQRYPAVTLNIEGHSDERGTREYNLGLSARRANAAKEYLVSLGVNGSRLETIAYGKDRPACAASNEACWSQNRRDVSVLARGTDVTAMR
jgi:peptidoglycan-associated lipoprotein